LHYIGSGLTKANKKILGYLLKLTIVCFAAYFIYQKLTNNKNLDEFFLLINQLSQVKVYSYLALIFALMLVNWLLESSKWQFLLVKIEKISFYKAVESVFCGLTWAVFTPNRIGEYGGRILFLSPRKRIQGAIAMSVGQIAQMVITNVLGATALLWFIYHFKPIDSWLFIAISLLVLGFCFFFLLFYFNIRWLEKSLSSIKFLKRFQKYFSVLSQYHQKELMKVMLYSLARFAVFTSQYLLVIHLLITEINLAQSAMMVFLLFFIQSALPSLDLLDIGVRSLTATYFFSFITNQDIAIMAAAALIWLFNLILPAIIGSFFVFKLKFFDYSNS
jgi:hypothetical protein